MVSMVNGRGLLYGITPFTGFIMPSLNLEVMILTGGA